MQRANDSRDIHSLVGELRQKLATRGLLRQNPLR